MNVYICANVHESVLTFALYLLILQHYILSFPFFLSPLPHFSSHCFLLTLSLSLFLSFTFLIIKPLFSQSFYFLILNLCKRSLNEMGGGRRINCMFPHELISVMFIITLNFSSLFIILE